MISRLALALAIAAVSTGATAQTNKQTLQELLAPYYAKTNPAVPIAPPQPVVSSAPAAPAAAETAVYPFEISAALDACVIKAIGRLPNINAMRVTHSSHKYYKTENQRIYGQVFVSVEVSGHQAHYSWLCGVDRNSGLSVLTQ